MEARDLKKLEDKVNKFSATHKVRYVKLYVNADYRPSFPKWVRLYTVSILYYPSDETMPF